MLLHGPRISVLRRFMTQGIQRLGNDGKNAATGTLGGKFGVPEGVVGKKKRHEVALAAICELMDVPVQAVQSGVKTGQVVQARTMWLCYCCWTLGWSMREVARRADVSHSAVRRAIDRHDEFMAFVPVYAHVWAAMHAPQYVD